MNIRKIKSVLFLILVIAFSNCATQDNQPNVKQPAIRVSAPDVDSAEPAIAGAKDGNIFVVWVEHKADKSADVMLQQYDLNGQQKGDKVRVNPQIGQATAWRGDPPSIAISEDKLIYVGWTAKVETTAGLATTLYLSVSRDDGRSFDSPVKVNDDSLPSDHGMHSLAIDNSGRVFMAWLDERYLITNSPALAEPAAQSSVPKAETKTEGTPHQHQEPNREVYFAVSENGGKSFTANRRLASDVCPCCKTSILAAPGGQIFVGWRQVLNDNFRHIALAASTDNGSTFSSPVIVSDDQWQINACPVSGPALTLTADKTLKVVWFTAGKAGQPGLYSAESKDAGKTFLPRTMVNDSIVSGTPVLLSDNKLKNFVVWEGDGKMMSAILKDKTPSGENQQELGDGNVVSATVNGEKIFISYVRKENDRHIIWLSFLNKPLA